jgi:hypothetical protein
MDILRNLFGALTSGIIRLLVTVGILVAVYFLILRPVLDTTGEAIKEANKSLETTLPTTKAEKLANCVRRANGNVDRIQRCARKF